MNFELLQAAMPAFDELRIINKSIVKEGSAIQIAGLIRQGKTLKLYALQFDEQVYEAELLAEEQELSKPSRKKSLTNRQKICNVNKVEYGIPMTCIQSINIGTQEFKISCISSYRLNDNDFKPVFLIAEFIKNGLKPCSRLALRDFSHLIFAEIELEGEYENIPFGNQMGGVMLRFGNNHIRQYPVGKRMRLNTGRNYSRSFQFKDKQSERIHRFYIHRVYLMDIWEEIERSFSDPRHLERMSEVDLLKMKKSFFEQLEVICPRGMYFPVIEYEAEDDISFEFHTVEYLNSRHEILSKNGSIGIIITPDQPIGRHGMKLKSAVIQSPVSKETEMLYVELLRYNQIIKHEDLIF
ncbi:hypothetical protein OXPF_42540 [Oxobacter pfennigii]|uniref:Uncharacterized protein n=1 Tax=Oxobacter pfennigii TaxID=36849 RepID=A0A0P8YS48_9CLOT|nr:hypothetical protein [Oxobacter pfennigii]KPU42469.1 hypothetical protein OXPF_42540 [Oxobacter pfennigii]